MISVLIANYNNGRYIEECINSILVQTYQDFEIYIVDDCSTDNSVDIINNLLVKDKRIRYSVNDKNEGIAFTRDRLLKEAKGEYVTFLDSDDAISQYALQLLYNKHLEFPEASIVHSPFYLCDENLENWKLSSYPKPIPEGESHMTCPGITPLVLFRKELYSQIDKIENVTAGEDTDLYFKLEELGKPICLDIPLYYYRRSHKNSLSSDVKKAAESSFLVIEKAIKRRKEKFPNTKYYTDWEFKMMKKRYDNLSFTQSITSGYLWFIIKNLYKQRKAILSDMKFIYHKYKI
ncbi:putative glycosyltransferase [Flavobacteriaceae bacterium UJ101]|nr:putative glycosyltransferase [Flavobacteriaceae bacterium UJ101]